MTQDQDLVLTVAELAEYLKLSEKTVRSLAGRGDLPGRKVGNQWRFRKQEIDEWLRSRDSREPRDDDDTSSAASKRDDE